MKLKIPYLMGAILAAGSLLHLADTPGISAAPLITFDTLSGHNINLAVPMGKTRLVSFWSPDCSICERDRPNLSHLHQQFSENELEIIAVAMPYDSHDKVESHIDNHAILYQVAHDIDGTIGASFPGVRFTPTTFLIDSEGEIVWRHVGRLNATEASGQITETLQLPKLADKR